MPTLLGLNSGTSADGVDAVAVRFEGEMPTLPLEILACVHRPYSTAERDRIERLVREGHGTLEEICHLNFAIGQTFLAAGLDALKRAGLRGPEIEVAGSHGQTLWHQPPPMAERQGLLVSTWQTGEAAVMADGLGCRIASDFRVADIAAGGQGAPLTPILDHLLFTHSERTRLRLNIGGIANLTYLPPRARSEEVIAFDTGPGNTLIDQAVQAITGGVETCDRDGARARRGRVHEGLLGEMLADPHFALAPPKSTGRELFGPAWLSRARSRAGDLGLSDDDFIATLTELTPASIADAVERHLPERRPDEVILHGGGAMNPIIVASLRRRLGVPVTTVEEFGIPLQALEPLLFALLGWLCFQRRAVFYPKATGMKRPAVLGKLSRPPA
jgi:anhydro-N-acetylmuramic acid kinase